VLALAPSTVSKHLFLLRGAGLIETEKEGRWIHCRATPLARRWALPRLPEDRRRLKAVLRIEPAELCRRQLRGRKCG
jgi:DNA-binding transcriptional ArsR family regulator